MLTPNTTPSPSFYELLDLIRNNPDSKSKDWLLLDDRPEHLVENFKQLFQGKK